MSYKLNKHQEAWLKALESGKYKQAKGVLHNPKSKGYCCLGVAVCVVEGIEEPKGVSLIAYPMTRLALKLISGEGDSCCGSRRPLTYLNDEWG